MSRVLAFLALAVPAAAIAQGALGDPTRPTSLSEPESNAAAAAQGPHWRLQSTLVADSRRVAVINGRTVAQGGRIDGATVVEVRREGVTLDHDGQRIVLHLLPEALNIKRAGG